MANNWNLSTTLTAWARSISHDISTLFVGEAKDTNNTNSNNISSSSSNVILPIRVTSDISSSGEETENSVSPTLGHCHRDGGTSYNGARSENLPHRPESERYQGDDAKIQNSSGSAQQTATVPARHVVTRESKAGSRVDTYEPQSARRVKGTPATSAARAAGTPARGDSDTKVALNTAEDTSNQSRPKNLGAIVITYTVGSSDDLDESVATLISASYDHGGHGSRALTLWTEGDGNHIRGHVGKRDVYLEPTMPDAEKRVMVPANCHVIHMVHLDVDNWALTRVREACHKTPPRGESAILVVMDG